MHFNLWDEPLLFGHQDDMCHFAPVVQSHHDLLGEGDVTGALPRSSGWLKTGQGKVLQMGAVHLAGACNCLERHPGEETFDSFLLSCHFVDLFPSLLTHLHFRVN